MNYMNSKSEYRLKHILSSDWIIAKYILDTEDYIEFLIDYDSSISFEKDDKILYSIKSENSTISFNSTVIDIDFPTYDKITIRIKKPFERRTYSRYNVSLEANLSSINSDEICNIVDISKNGFKILSNSELNLKDLIDLNANINSSDSIKSSCLIVYKQDNIIYQHDYKYIYGVKVKSINRESVTLLDDFISSLKSSN